MEKRSFSERCYEILKSVPRGRVTTYQALARALGTKGCRAVGSVLHRNPHAPRVPCHRVVRSDGSIGGFARGLAQKIKLLEREGVRIKAGKIENFWRVFAPPKPSPLSARAKRSC